MSLYEALTHDSLKVTGFKLGTIDEDHLPYNGFTTHYKNKNISLYTDYIFTGMPSIVCFLKSCMPRYTALVNLSCASLSIFRGLGGLRITKRGILRL